MMSLTGSFLEVVVAFDVDSSFSSSIAGEVGLGMCISKDLVNSTKRRKEVYSEV